MKNKPTYEELEQRVQELAKITDGLRQSEADLRMSRERYHIHFTLANDVIYSLDTRFRVKTVSPNVEQVLGYAPQELIGKTFLELRILHPDFIEKAVANAMGVLSGERIHSTLYHFIKKDGSLRYGEVSGVPYKQNGKVVEVISVARDVTDRIKMEKSLRESEERFRAIFASARDCIFIKNLDLEYIFINPCMEKVFGLTSEEITRMGDRDLFGEESDKHGKETDLRVISGEVVEEEYSKLIGGSGMTFHIIKVPLRDSSGKVSGMCGIARDITDRKRYEQDLKAKEAELAHQAKFLEEMNIALKVLLDSREKEKKEAQEIIVSKARKIIYPYIEKMEEELKDNIYLNIIKSNLDDLLSSFSNTLSTQFINNLTPMEVRIADLVKHGKSTKEIAALLNVSSFTVSFHRSNIRKKCGLHNTKKNLRAYLHGGGQNNRS